MVRLVSYTSLDAGPRTKGKPRETAPKITSLVTKSSQPGKRDRKKRKSSEKRALEVIDLTIDKEETQRTVNKRVTDLEDCISRLSNADKLAKSEAGPSRQRSPTYIPTSFTSIPRSILACISDRLSFDLSSRDVSPRKGLNQNGDINVLERLRPFSPAPSTRPDPALPPDGVSEHFEPPGLSSTSMMPNIDPSSGQVELKKPDGLGEDQGRAEEEMKLLLPSHVLLDTKSPARTLQAQGQGERVDDRRGRESSMEGLHFLDDDVTKGVPRYFDASSLPKTAEATFLATADQSKICKNCKRPGHRIRDCLHTVCMTCGAEDEHERRDCPLTLVCFGCRQKGHRQVDCPNPASRSSRRQGCDRCGNRDHPENSCPSLWRIYSYRSQKDRQAVQFQKVRADGWAKEAIGGGANEEWCYNCAKKGHFGDDCQQRRGSLARLYVPSAFSIAMSSRGPFTHTVPPQATSLSTHARWTDDDELPDMTKGFQGEMAGRKTRDKERRRMMDYERGTQDDGDDWFDGPKQSKGPSIRGRESSSQKRPKGSDGRASRSPIKRGDLPFSHSPFMSPTPAKLPANGISFGKLALPVDSSTLDKVRRREKPALAAVNGTKSPDTPATMMRQAASPKHHPVLGPSHANKRRKREEVSERDWELEWRASGNGGGPVIGWGKDVYREEKKAKKDAKKEAAKISGQRYTGGY